MTDIRTTSTQVLLSPNSEADRFLPEGPRAIQLEGREALLWVNIQTSPEAKIGALHLRFWDTGEQRSLPLANRPGFVFPTDREEIVVVGQGHEIGTVDLSTGAWTRWATLPHQNPRVIINDGEIVPGGRAIVFGTKDTQFAEYIAALYLFTLDDQQLSTLAEGMLCSNGKVFTQGDGGLILYDIDTPRRSVMRYRVDLTSGSIQADREVVDLHSEEGLPDGMADTGDGTAIIALFNPHRGGDGQALRVDLGSGKTIERWTTPGSPRVTCPLLVEREGQVKLVLTTAVEGMPDEMRRASPEAGSLFMGATDLKRLPATEVVRL